MRKINVVTVEQVEGLSFIYNEAERKQLMEEMSLALAAAERLAGEGEYIFFPSPPMPSAEYFLDCRMWCLEGVELQPPCRFEEMISALQWSANHKRWTCLRMEGVEDLQELPKHRCAHIRQAVWGLYLASRFCGWGKESRPGEEWGFMSADGLGVSYFPSGEDESAYRGRPRIYDSGGIKRSLLYGVVVDI